MEAGVKGLILGLIVALAVGVVDLLWNTPTGRIGPEHLRAAVCVLIGSFGGLLGGIVAQGLVNLTTSSVGVPSGAGTAEHQSLFSLADALIVFGWTLTGLLIGASVGTFEFLTTRSGGSRSKLLKGLAGGAVGGLAGGAASVWLRGTSAVLFHDKPSDQLWSRPPSDSR